MPTEINAILDQISVRDAVMLRLNHERFSQRQMAQQLYLHKSTVKTAIERLEKLTGSPDMGGLSRWWGSFGCQWLLRVADQTGLGPIDFGQLHAQGLSR